MAEFDLTKPEVWYPIPSLPGYEISSHYRVGSRWTNFGITKKERRILRIQRTDAKRGSRPYISVRMPDDDGRKRHQTIRHICRMVAEVAHGPCPPGKMVLHRDDNPENNHPSNLYYGDKRDNMLDAIRNGKWRATRGAAKWSARLDDHDIIVIRRLIGRGVPQNIVADLFEVHPSHVSKVAAGRKWAHLSGPGPAIQ